MQEKIKSSCRLKRSTSDHATKTRTTNARHHTITQPTAGEPGSSGTLHNVQTPVNPQELKANFSTQSCNRGRTSHLVQTHQVSVQSTVLPSTPRLLEGAERRSVSPPPKRPSNDDDYNTLDSVVLCTDEPDPTGRRKQAPRSSPHDNEMLQDTALYTPGKEAIRKDNQETIQHADASLLKAVARSFSSITTASQHRRLVDCGFGAAPRTTSSPNSSVSSRSGLKNAQHSTPSNCSHDQSDQGSYCTSGPHDVTSGGSMTFSLEIHKDGEDVSPARMASTPHRNG